jgi:hypothetical protein
LMKATTIEMELEDWFAFWTESAGKEVPWWVFDFKSKIKWLINVF